MPAELAARRAAGLCWIPRRWTAVLHREAPSARDCAAAAGALLQGCKNRIPAGMGGLPAWQSELQTAFTATDRDNDARLSALAARIEKIVDSTSFYRSTTRREQLFQLDMISRRKRKTIRIMTCSCRRRVKRALSPLRAARREHWFRLGRSMAAADLHTGFCRGRGRCLNT